MFAIKPQSEMTQEEIDTRDAERARIREQILEAQRTNANRDDKALAKERAWYRRNAK